MFQIEQRKIICCLQYQTKYITDSVYRFAQKMNIFDKNSFWDEEKNLVNLKLVKFLPDLERAYTFEL